MPNTLKIFAALILALLGGWIVLRGSSEETPARPPPAPNAERPMPTAAPETPPPVAEPSATPPGAEPLLIIGQVHIATADAGPRLDRLLLSRAKGDTVQQAAIALGADRKIYCNARVVAAMDLPVIFEWQRGSAEPHRWTYKGIRSNAPWRTASERTLAQSGSWRVAVYHSAATAENLLGQIEFEVR